MNAAHEDGGEEALKQAVRSHGVATVRLLIQHVIRAAAAFTAGAPQHDPMTTIALRALRGLSVQSSHRLAA